MHPLSHPHLPADQSTADAEQHAAIQNQSTTVLHKAFLKPSQLHAIYEYDDPTNYPL